MSRSYRVDLVLEQELEEEEVVLKVVQDATITPANFHHDTEVDLGYTSQYFVNDVEVTLDQVPQYAEQLETLMSRVVQDGKEINKEIDYGR